MRGKWIFPLVENLKYQSNEEKTFWPVLYSLLVFVLFAQRTKVKSQLESYFMILIETVNYVSVSLLYVLMKAVNKSLLPQVMLDHRCSYCTDIREFFVPVL